MARPGRVDYHVHYHVDGCVSDEMTLENTAAEAVRLGLEEICVLKHYTDRLPNGGDRWVSWKRIIPEQFEAFLRDVRSFQPPAGLTIFAGTESEIQDDSGAIAIPHDDQDRLDAVLLSVHWLPEMRIIPAEARALWVDGFPAEDTDAGRQWAGIVGEIPPEAILANFAQCYVRAIEKNPRVRVLAHMFDGLGPLRDCSIDLASIGERRCIELMEPVMRACVEHRVLWELLATPVELPGVLHRANELGVLFCPAADAHQLDPAGWGPLCNHAKAEAYVDSLGLTKGVIELAAS